MIVYKSNSLQVAKSVKSTRSTKSSISAVNDTMNESGASRSVTSCRRAVKVYNLESVGGWWKERIEELSGCLRDPEGRGTRDPEGRGTRDPEGRGTRGLRLYPDAVLVSSDAVPFYVSRSILSLRCDYFRAAFDNLGGDSNMHNNTTLMEGIQSGGSVGNNTVVTSDVLPRPLDGKHDSSRQQLTPDTGRVAPIDGIRLSKPVTTFDEIHSTVLEIVIKYCYSGMIQGVTFSNIEPVLKAFDRFNLVSGLELLHQFLVDNVTISNALSIYRLGHKYWSRGVIEASRDVILYEARSLPDSLLTAMTGEEMLEFISDDRFNVSREEQTYDLIRRWMEVSVGELSERMSHFPTLMHHVRFGNAGIRLIESEIIGKNPWICGYPDLREYLHLAKGVLADIQGDPVPAKFDVVKYPFLRPRIPRDIILTFGGWSGASATSVIETYDCRVNKWYTFSPLDTHPRAYHGMVYFDGLVFIIGGFDGTRHFSTVTAFDPVTKTWHEKGNMTRARCYVSTVSLAGFIYACGGFDGQTRTDTCERYDPTRNQWSAITSMNHNRSDASAAVLNGKIYIVGGFDGIEVLPTVESFDPLTMSWTLVEMMASPRSGVQAVAFEDFLYVFGGNNGQERQTSAEKYDPDRQSWSPVPQMKTPRSNFSAIAVEGLIYIVGGFNGVTTINDVECYDPKKNAWHDMWSMTLHRSALSACVVSRLPNAKEFTWLRRELHAKSASARKSAIFEEGRRTNPIQ